MPKRYFRINTGRYGGEVVVGTVDKNFVDYWIERDSEELAEHLHAVDFDPNDGDSDSPGMVRGENFSWHELDDLEHHNGPYHDNVYYVTEIELDKDAEYVNGLIQWKDSADRSWDELPYNDISDMIRFDGYENYLYSRECYLQNHEFFERTNKDLREAIPVITVHSSEKGGFGEVYIQTDQDFDPSKLFISTLETDVCELIESYWYDGVQLEPNYDCSDTVGKAFYASVGYMIPEYRDEVPSREEIEEMLKENAFED